MEKLKKPLIILIIIFIILLLIFPLIIINLFRGYKDVEIDSPEAYELDPKEVELFTDDELLLKAWQVDAIEPKGMVVFLSGLNGPSVTEYFSHAKMFKEEGYSSFLLELRAHGLSQGDTVTPAYDEVLDVKAAIKYIKSQKESKDLPIILFGNSFGASVAINSLGKVDGIDGIISLSAFSSIEDVFDDILVNLKLPKGIAKLEKKLFDMYMTFTFGRSKIDNRPIYNIKNLNNKPILLMHSEDNKKIPFNSYKRLVLEADKNSDNTETYIVKGDKPFIVEDRFFKNPKEDTNYYNAIFDFLKKYF